MRELGEKLEDYAVLFVVLSFVCLFLSLAAIPATVHTYCESQWFFLLIIVVDLFLMCGQWLLYRRAKLRLFVAIGGCVSLMSFAITLAWWISIARYCHI